ncbi:MAG: hypothetical protein E7352_04065 [Clostridiales bacterium]|nr:hypothetical protein [Clostridiales bacterium]
MVSVYKDADYLAVYKQRKRLLYIFWALTVAYLGFSGGCLAYHISLPYRDPMLIWPKVMVISASILYMVFIFPFMSIKFGRVNRYYKLMGFLSEGLKSEEKNYFYCFEEKALQKDNVDVMGCVFETWNKKHSEWMEREAFWDKEKPLPAFDSGDYVQYVVQSNFIVQYRILQKQALEFQEEDDEVDAEESVEEETSETESQEQVQEETQEQSQE